MMRRYAFIIGFCLKRISSIALKGKAQSNIFMRMLPVSERKSEEIFTVYLSLQPATADM